MKCSCFMCPVTLTNCKPFSRALYVWVGTCHILLTVKEAALAVQITFLLFLVYNLIRVTKICVTQPTNSSLHWRSNNVNGSLHCVRTVFLIYIFNVLYTIWKTIYWCMIIKISLSKTDLVH